ncbi:hypothetical protein JCM10207_003479 [Rhodosporidiobolus poonsookiae]
MSSSSYTFSENISTRSPASSASLPPVSSSTFSSQPSFTTAPPSTSTSAAEPQSSTAPGPQPSKSSSTTWTAAEEKVLVEEAGKATPVRWNDVQTAFSQKKLAFRSIRALRTHLALLKARAKAQNVELTGPVTPPPWTLVEEGRLLAVWQWAEESGKPVAWSVEGAAFPGRALQDLQIHRSNLSANLKSAVHAETKDKLRKSCEEELAKLRMERGLAAPSGGSTSVKSAPVEPPQTPVKTRAATSTTSNPSQAQDKTAALPSPSTPRPVPPSHTFTLPAASSPALPAPFATPPLTGSPLRRPPFSRPIDLDLNLEPVYEAERAGKKRVAASGKVFEEGYRMLKRVRRALEGGWEKA